MPQYLVEHYVSRDGQAVVEHEAALARHAAEQLCLEGTSVRYLRSIFVPDDETCFHVYEADSVDGVRAAVARARLPLERVSEAIET